MTSDTLAGPVSAEVNGRMVKVQMPEPKDLAIDLDLEHQAGWVSVDFINTGVPHVVVRVENLSDLPVIRQGRWVRHHERFSPDGTNANFMRITGPNRLEVRTYERGVEDETLACGTGAIACALISSARGQVQGPVRVGTRGGEDLVIHFQMKGQQFREVWLEGGTSIIYQGRLHEEALE
jgi:diaminopimelate epimerase